MSKQNKNKIIEKVIRQIENAKKKIDALSVNHLCNTWKRIREQENRDQKISSYRFDIEILTYLLNTIEARELTKLELALITNSFRIDIDGYYRRNVLYNSDKRPSTAVPIIYPEVKPGLAEWYNAEVPKKQKRLNKAGIYNTKQLLDAVDEYSAIVEAASKPIDQTQMKIKKLERECIMMQKGDINFTPPEVAKHMVELARIDSNSVVLEPSAGIARIADEIKTVTPNVDVVERMSNFRELLALKGYNLVGDDFMQYTTDKLYDAVIANPPFSDEEAHIKHMYELLKPGGTLVTICSPHWTFAQDKKAVEFRNWVEELDGYTQDLPSGTFEMTGVAAKILVIEKKVS